MKSLILTKKLDYKGNTFCVNFKKKKQTKVKMKNIEKIMSRNIPEIMEKISCFLCKKQDKLFINIPIMPSTPWYAVGRRRDG
ncbi:MAG: hypothetical protein IJS43_02510, partial [Bacteroidaceae bacterium]|nr:hypothetical protein [Bacteroidaceae bacterium]